MVFLTRSLFILSFLVFTAPKVRAKCYNFDGTASTDAFKPCNGTAEASMCCRLDVPGAANNNGDVCGDGLKYGLCGVTGSQLWRESCTDPTWKSPACLKLCVDGDGAHNISAITTCDDGSYCCGTDNTNCCTAGKGMFIVENQVTTSLPTTTVSISTPPTPTASDSTSTLPQDGSFRVSSASLSPPSAVTAANGAVTTIAVIVPASNGFSTGAKIGLGIGIPILVFALLGFAFYFLRRYWQQKLQQYKSDAQTGDTATILPGETNGIDPSRPSTGYNTKGEGATTKANFSGEMPTMPDFFDADNIDTFGTFGEDVHSGIWPYNGDKEEYGDKKESYHMKTFAIEIDDGPTADNRIFPINPHLVEMDAYESKANNEGLFEMAEHLEEDEETEVYLGLVELFKADDANQGSTSNLGKPAEREDEENIFSDPKERPRLETEEKLSHTGYDPMSKDSEEKEVTLIDEKESHSGFNPRNRESEEKEIAQSDEKEMIVEHQRIATLLAEAGSSTVLSEKDRSRPRTRVSPRAASASIPKSQFSRSPSPASIPHSPLNGILATSSELIQPSRASRRTVASEATDADDTAIIVPRRSLSRGKAAHVSSLMADTRIPVRPRKKSIALVETTPAAVVPGEQELLRVLEYESEPSSSGPKSPIEMPS